MFFGHSGPSLENGTVDATKFGNKPVLKMARNLFRPGGQESDKRAVRSARTARKRNRGIAFARL
jgi:hypothetical protein